MLLVQICVGSSCHIKGSQEIVELFEASVNEHGIQDEVVLYGSLCLGKCNREGVTIQVNDEIFVGITKENFREFFKEKILKEIEKQRN